ncbi:MAG: EAL domain-containing protein [Gammaproteobacteria bacterium]
MPLRRQLPNDWTPRSDAYFASLLALRSPWRVADDFGVGFSSFFALKQLPVDYVKIDGSFIRNLYKDMDDQIIVRAMAQIAQGLGKNTIAEFVDDERTLSLLRDYEINFSQGYLLGKPLPLEQAFSMLPRPNRRSLPKQVISRARTRS